MRTRVSSYLMSATVVTAPLMADPPPTSAVPDAGAFHATEWSPTLVSSDLALRRLGCGALLGRARGVAPDTGYSYGSTTGALPTRTFSIDRPSPTVSAFFARSHLPDDLLTVPPPEAAESAEDVGGMGPWVSFPGEAFPRHLIGFTPTLDVDALSRNHGSIVPRADSAWRIFFSVRLGSSGDPRTGVDDQSFHNQQAGDLFESRQLYSPVLPGGAVAHGAVEGNELSINQDELLLTPSVGPDAFNAAQLDELDAWDDAQVVDEATGALAERIYYSVQWETDPDWAMAVFTLPAGWDVGDAPPLPDLAPIYANRTQIGLTSNDDIDGLVVFDADGDGAFTHGDAILLSLRQGSTSLDPGFFYHFGGTGSPSDVFLVYKAGPTFLSRLATDAQLGLAVSPADLDALEVRSEVVELEARPLLEPYTAPLRKRCFVIP